jgi:prenyltransferase beta subunit
MDKIDSALQKACTFMTEKRNAEGYWSSDTIKHNEPLELQKPIVRTGEAILTYVAAKNKESLPLLSYALQFCLDNSLEDSDPLSLWAWKLMVASLSNTQRAKKIQKQCADLLIRQQNKAGFWPYFPGKTYNLNNYLILWSLKDYDCKQTLNRAAEWLKKTRAKDKQGWSFDDKQSKSEVSFTSNIILTLISLGEDPTSEILQTAKRFLEDAQLPGGGWHSSSRTVYGQPTTYGTAIATLSLMLLANNPLNEKVAQGVNYILKRQLSDGGWSLTEEDKVGKSYTTYHCALTLAFYKFLKENLSLPKYSILKGKVAPQYLTQILWKAFEEDRTYWLKLTMTQSMLNSKLLGSTNDAVNRRKDILKILDETRALTVAEIIDELKKKEIYSHLKKRSHITQIKNDVEYLKSLNIIYEFDGKYFIVADLLS